MKKLLLLPVIVIALVGIYLARPTQKPSEQTLAVEQPITQVKYETPTVERLLELTNIEREKAGVKPLKLDERLNKSAQKKVEDMQITGLSHENSDGTRGVDYINEIIDCYYVSENLLAGSYDVEQAYYGQGGWMSSPPHKKAILDPRYEYVGFAYKNGYVAQHFCDSH